MLPCALAPAETLDRVVAAVGTQALTASDVQSEYRLELFLDGRTPSGAAPDAATLDQVRERLIERRLLEREVAVEGVTVPPDDGAVAQRLEEARAKFGSEGAFQAALQQLGLNENGLREVLAKQEAILRTIDLRFRPLAAVDAAEIEAYYRDTLLPGLARQGTQQPPALAEVESRIREILVQKKIDDLLADWLKRTRVERDVRLFGGAGLEQTP